MLENLLQKKFIKLPECKCPEEMGCVDDPKYYNYHRIVSHLMEECFILKELIMILEKQGRIHLDLDEVVELNNETITFGSFYPIVLHAPAKTLEAYVGIVLSQSAKLNQIQVSYNGTLHFCFDNESMLDSEEGWTLAT